MLNISVDFFIKNHVSLRLDSMFEFDLSLSKELLKKKINNKSLLVIGGAGTIGSSFIKAALKFKPRRLIVVDTNENGLTELTRDLRSSIGLNIPDDYKTYPINFGSDVFKKLLIQEGPFEIIANFAAHKHVRSEKDQYSIEAMIQNNVIQALHLLELLKNHKPEHFFCVSTDKAANPVNVMGASKKLMEEVILAYAQEMPITTARFANVAFSNGSLLAGFIERIMKQQPFSSPLDVKRYFVSPEESGQLCLLACMLGESGDIFFPKLREEQMITFSDIAVKFLNQMGLEPDYCDTEQEARIKASNLQPNSKKYPVYFFKTDTSGEKLFEEFFTREESVAMNQFKALGVVKGAATKTIQEAHSIVNELEHLFQKEQLNKSDIVSLLQEFLPNFNHIETGKSLDQKM